MTVAFVADADVTNGTAGTSVVVSRPTGTADGHVLVAFIAAVGNPSISTPSGWTLIGTQDGSTGTRIAAYQKVASSEPASWTWTLGSSQRNIGWVGAYSGVDTSSPVFDTLSGSAGSGTSYTSGSDTINIHRQGGLTTAAVVGVRTASGSATTWTASVFATEVADLSTNAGSGTDIAGCVSNRANSGSTDVTNATVVFTASQSQIDMASWAVSLRPAFTGYGGGLVERTVEVAWGADPDGDPTDWVWTDITEDVLDDGSITATTGRDERGAIDQEANPTRVDLRLRNWRSPDGGVTRTNEGQYTPDNPDSPNYPNVVQYVPLRIRQPYGYSPPTTRYTVLVDSWAPAWDASGRAATVDVTAYGRLQRIRDTRQPTQSLLRRFLAGGIEANIYPHAFYPVEDGSGASRIASAFAGHQPMGTTGGVSFAAVSDLDASLPLPALPENGVIAGVLGPGYTPTGQWCALLVAKLPETPVGVESRIALFTCTGTAREWALWIVPGSPDTLNLRVATFGSSLLDASVAIVEAEHYGQWRVYSIGATQDGANVDYHAWSLNADGGVSISGTLNSRTIGSARFARLVASSALAGMAVGHIALYTDPVFNIASDPEYIAAQALDGKQGEAPETRFARLCAEENILSDTVSPPAGSTLLTLGPQPPAQIGDLIKQPGETDHGLMHDGTPSGALTLVARASMYNQDPEIELDGSLGQVPGDVRPVFDGQGRITDSTVTREGGSSARYEADARGSKPDAKTLSLETDQHLYEIAGWRVALGSQPSMRYTRLPFNLRRSPELTESWFRSTAGSRMRATNMVTAHGPTDPDGIIVGWIETIRRDSWVVEPVLASARPYNVPVMEAGDDKTWRMESGGSEIAASATSSATSLLVATTAEQLWTTAVGSVPFDADVNGERVTVSSVSSSVRDTFTRSVTDGWSTSDSGHTWTNSGGAAADYDVNGSKGFQTHPSANVIHHSTIDIGTSDHRVRGYVNLSVGSVAGAGATGFVLARMLDTFNWYAARVGYATSGVVTLQIAKMVGGVGNIVGTGSWSLGTVANFAATQFIVQLDVRGSTLSASAWDATDTEPFTWRVIETDTDLTTGTLVGLASRRDTGNTDASLIFAWDNFAVLNPQAFTVTRGVAGGAAAKAHSVGAPVKLWRARGLAL
jgi:hypothetical protein